MPHAFGMIINAKSSRASLLSKDTPRRPSKVTVPPNAHPFARLAFAELKRQRITYAELEHLSGVLNCTVKEWRKSNTPGLASVEAVLGSLGWTLVAIPEIDILPDEVRAALETAAQHFRSDAQTYGYALKVAAEWPKFARENLARECKLAPGSLPALEAAAAAGWPIVELSQPIGPIDRLAVRPGANNAADATGLHRADLAKLTPDDRAAIEVHLASSPEKIQ